MKMIKMLKRELLDFCATANIHGLSHVGNERNHPILRFIWFATVAIAFGLSAICIKSSFEGRFGFHCILTHLWTFALSDPDCADKCFTVLVSDSTTKQQTVLIIWWRIYKFLGWFHEELFKIFYFKWVLYDLSLNSFPLIYQLT